MLNKYLCAVTTAILACGAAGADRIRFDRDDEKGRLAVMIDGREAFVYQYAASLDLPHYWPFNSPSGKNMLVQKTKPYPHHRAFWFADTVQRDGGRKVSLYNALYSGKDRSDPPYRDHVRHTGFETLAAAGDRGTVESTLVWETNETPLLDERRVVRIAAMEKGQYFLDITFTLTAAHGDVHFVSDAVHYAWPYLRINDRFNGAHGGTITSDRGATGQKATNMKVARWIDYANTVDGVTEGVAVFQYPDGADHRWLTREYGTFGPRRPDERSGKKFTLKKGATLTQRVGVFVHAGSAKTGRVAERYAAYVADAPAPASEKTAASTAAPDPPADRFAAAKTCGFGESRKPLSAVRDYIRAAAEADYPAIEKRLLAILAAKDATYRGKLFACRMLARVGSDASADPLAKLLDDETLAHAALIALKANPSAAAAAALRGALDDVEGGKLVQVISAIALRRDEKAVAPLAKPAGEDTPAGAAAIHALGRIGTAAAADALAQAFTAAGAKRKAAVADAILACAERLLAAGDTDRAKKLYETVRSADDLPVASAAAARGLALCSPEFAKEFVVAALEGDDPARRAEAIRMVPRLRDAAVTAVTAVLPDLAPAAAAAVIGALESGGCREALPAVTKAAGSDEPAVACAALAALGTLGDAGAVDTLVAALGDEKTRDAAAGALAKLKGEGVTEKIAAAIGAAETSIKPALVAAAGSRGDPGLAPALLAAAADAAVARAALRALRECGTAAQLPELVALLATDLDDAARKAAERAAVIIAERTREPGARSAPFLAALPETAGAARASVVRVLGKLGEKPAAEKVAVLRDSDDAAVRDAAIRALAGWPGPGPAETLLAIAREAKELKYNVVALRGYARMLGQLDGAGPEQYAAGKKAARRDEEKQLFTETQVSGLEVTSSGTCTIVKNGLLKGATWASDREYTFTDIPAALRGATYIVTTMDDKDAGGDAFLSFRISAPATVYVGYDGRSGPPGWMKDWKATGEAIATDANGLKLKVYAQRFDAGTVTLGGCAAAAMYTVAIK